MWQEVRCGPAPLPVMELTSASVSAASCGSVTDSSFAFSML